MSDALVTTVIGTISAVFLAILGLWGAKKFKIGSAQEKLVETLRDLIEAQDRKIKELTDALEKANARIAILEAEVNDLKGLTVEQALEIQDNRSQLETLAHRTPRRKQTDV